MLQRCPVEKEAGVCNLSWIRSQCPAERMCAGAHVHAHTRVFTDAQEHTPACTQMYVHMRKHTSTLLTVTGPQLKTQVLTALSPTLFFTCHHSQRKGEPHGGAAGRGRRDAGQTWGQASERHLSGSAHSGPGALPLRALQAPEGRAAPPPPGPANPKAACSGSNPWASDSGKGRILKHHTSSQPVKIQNPPADPGLWPG